MKLVFVTQELDPSHPALAQTIDLVEALAGTGGRACDRRARRRVERRSCKRSRSHIQRSPRKLRRGLQFEQSLHASLGRADAVLVHMVPEFAVLAAPAVRIRRIPFGLWYTHWHGGRAFRPRRASSMSFSASTARAFRSIPRRFVRSVTRSMSSASRLRRSRRTRGRCACLRSDERPDGKVLRHSSKLSPWRLTAARRSARDQGAVAQRRRGERTGRSSKTRRERRIRCAPACRSCRRSHVPEIPALIAAADVVVSPNEPRSGATLDKAVFEAAACAAAGPVSRILPSPRCLAVLPLPLSRPPATRTRSQWRLVLWRGPGLPSGGGGEAASRRAWWRGHSAGPLGGQ